jgi:hypothetical protein
MEKIKVFEAFFQIEVARCNVKSITKVNSRSVQGKSTPSLSVDEKKRPAFTGRLSLCFREKSGINNDGRELACTGSTIGTHNQLV